LDKPFAAPAVLVVGHQTDGKSALVEALMGEWGGGD
jgi:predicted AAA+ superfamily ATPase